jgi:serine/threonine protein kinase
MMDHPNIAKVLDAGATDTGRPYFDMELVRGVALTKYCDQHKLPVHERLELFIKVCQAIQHAHQKGIIHRDIKPSNILVTLHDGVPVPKVIDFGIAKATDQRLTDKTLFTQYDSFIGTPAYMSPEQAEMSGLDIDTRTDIYSLGVLLYELLTGVTPFNAQTLAQSGLDEIRRIIREDEPKRPSTRFSALDLADATVLAKHREEKVSALTALVRGDLDWIVMKCLEKDRTRRYETANGLAADLKRHLNNEAIVARPPTASSRLPPSLVVCRSPELAKDRSGRRETPLASKLSSTASDWTHRATQAPYPMPAGLTANTQGSRSYGDDRPQRAPFRPDRR